MKENPYYSKKIVSIMAKKITYLIRIPFKILEALLIP